MVRRLCSLAVLSMLLASEAAPWAALSDGMRACSCDQAVCCCAPRPSSRSCHEPAGRAQYVRCHHPRREAPLPLAVAVVPDATAGTAQDARVGRLLPSSPLPARDGFVGLDPPPPRHRSPFA